VLVQERQVVFQEAQEGHRHARVVDVPHVGDEHVDERGVGGHGDLLSLVLDAAEPGEHSEGVVHVRGGDERVEEARELEERQQVHVEPREPVEDADRSFAEVAGVAGQRHERGHKRLPLEQDVRPVLVDHVVLARHELHADPLEPARAERLVAPLADLARPAAVVGHGAGGEEVGGRRCGERNR
jgi:hypothetical protein